MQAPTQPWRSNSVVGAFSWRHLLQIAAQCVEKVDDRRLVSLDADATE